MRKGRKIMMQRTGKLSLAVAVMMAGGTFCYGQAQSTDKPAVRDTLPAGQGRAVDGAAASDRAGAAQPAAAHAAADHSAAGHAAMDPKQVDQQADQQLQKIQQQKDGMQADRLFVLEAGLGGHFEVALSQQALQKSQDPQVKQIAQRLIQDHQQANQQLAQVAQKLQVEVPMGLTSMKQQKLQIIGSLDSKAYDQKFLACMDALHAHDVHEFRSTTVTAKSPDVKQFAAQTLPVLQEHHQQIKQSATAMGLPADMNAAQPAGGRVPASTPPAGGSSGSGSTGSSSTGSGSSNAADHSTVTQPDAGKPNAQPKVGNTQTPSGAPSAPGGR
jgi:putative membrane protein